MKADRPFVILLTDRRKCGSAVRALPKPYLRQKTTEAPKRMARFATEGEAKKYLRSRRRKQRWLRRYCATITALPDRQAGGRKRDERGI